MIDQRSAPNLPCWKIW